MVPRSALAGLSLFAGTGMLDEGARAGFDFLGIDYRCVGYVERDAYAASALVARMESTALDQAPIWDDITTFDGRRWRGVVDCVLAGFPCQDISVAGSRAGLDGKRSGLFYEVLRVAADCGARFIFLENVAGIASATATVVDETEGELFERAAARVVGELADRGWDAEWLHLLASDVGAAHRRERWFCFAWRTVGHTDSARRPTATGGHEHARHEFVTASAEVADAGLQHGDIQQRGVRGKHPRSGQQMDNAQGERRRQGWTEHARHERRYAVVEHGGELADAQGAECERLGAEPSRSPGGLAENDREIFAPGPADPRWARIIADAPHLAPAVEPGICRVVNGLACRIDQYRADRLRCGGNGVVAAQAAAALAALVRRMNALNNDPQGEQP